ncbi:MAG: hypothetical protein WCR55_13620 [Lentisphaerota bacterium]
MKKPSYNNTYPKGEALCSKDSFVVKFPSFGAIFRYKQLYDK